MVPPFAPKWSLLRQARLYSLPMRRAALLSVLLLAIPMPGAERYEIDQAHAFVTFTVPHFLLDEASGSFGNVSGSLVYDPEDLANCSVAVTVKAASINTNVDARDAHLRSADFLDIEKYPDITFVSRSIRKAKGGYLATGDLTLRGVTKKIDVPFTVHGPIADPLPAGVKRLGVQAQMKINRRDFGIVWSRVMDDGTLFVGNDVTLKVHFEAIVPKERDGAKT
jgi:polyisoprenoid-binding protein YceI